MNRRSVLHVQRETESLRERTIKALREAIRQGHLKPGERLIERELCELTGVSRSSIREALRFLESEGLVERQGKLGMFVTQLTRQQAMEIYEVRAALEAEAARHFAARAGDAEIARLAEAFDRVDRAARNDQSAYGREIDAFFEVLFAGAGNTVARDIMKSLRVRINFLRNTTIRIMPEDRVKGSMDQMKLILDGIERRDGEAAAAASRGFVERSARFAMQYFDREGQGQGEGQGQADALGEGTGDAHARMQSGSA